MSLVLVVWNFAWLHMQDKYTFKTFLFVFSILTYVDGSAFLISDRTCLNSYKNKNENDLVKLSRTVLNVSFLLFLYAAFKPNTIASLLIWLMNFDRFTTSVCKITFGLTENKTSENLP